MRYVIPGLALALVITLTGCTKIMRPSTGNLPPRERVELALRSRNNPVELTGRETAVVTTNKGKFTIKLYSIQAPNTVRNFIRLAEAGFYDGLIWHRYVPGFVIQGGDPLGTGTGGAGYNINLEDSGMKHEKGAVGMARSQDPNSASCQFYVCLEAAPHLDGGYCVFGIVTQGMNVVNELRAQDAIESIVIKRP